MSSSDRAATDTANRRLDRVTGALDRVVPLRRLRPLDRLPSIKLKLAILIVAAVLITAITSTVGYLLNIDYKPTLGAAVIIALVLVQILARGITSPLREMASAADEMAAGNLDQRVSASAADEVGQLGRSFNDMVTHIAGLEQQRRDLIANVSHELRTPIAVIQGNVENLLDDVVDDEKATLTAMLRQARRLGGLVEQLLDLSRLEAGATPLHRRSIDLATVIDAVVEEAALRDPAPQLTIVGPTTLSIHADPERLHQVVANLIDNAIRHQPPGEAIVVELDVGPDRQTTITVSDSGPGIPTHALDAVFERFERAGPDGSSTTGSGLGLAIARGIVELHGGSIGATNLSPTGCAVTVTLPPTEP